MIRTVVTTNNNILTLPIPDHYIGKQIEVIAFTINEGKEARHKKKEVRFDAVKLDTKGFKFNRDEANER